MLKSYGLEETFTNFRPGTGPALDAAVLSSYRRGELSCSTTGRRRR